jgi:hypothetical protein
MVAEKLEGAITTVVGPAAKRTDPSEDDSVK